MTDNLAIFALPEHTESMVVRITSKRQVTLPARVLDALGIGVGDQIELIECSDGVMLRPRRIDLTRLGTLRPKLPPDRAPFDLESFREQTYDPALRD